MRGPCEFLSESNSNSLSPSPYNMVAEDQKREEIAKTMTTSGAHILLYPYQTSGHIIPLLDLAAQLHRRGLTITVLVTPSNLPLLQPLLSTNSTPSFQPLVLPAPPQQTTNRLPATVRGLYDLHYSAIVQWFHSHPSPPVAIVSDFFLGWTQQLASELGIARVIFSPSGAFGLSVSLSMWRDTPEITESAPILFPKLPNCPSYPWWQIPIVYRAYKESEEENRSPLLEFHRTSMVANFQSWGVVFNSFTDMEGPYVDHMKRELGHDKVWAVGPLLPPEDDPQGPVDRGGSSSMPPHEVLTWLDGCPDQSVVYICFGSRVVLTREQMNELTAGLELSGVRFVLCVRDPEGEHEVMIDGFRNRVAKRGLVIRGWAPQVLVLRHRAVGAFLTHCGWNSTLEGVSAGVVMLTWPMRADQFTNAKLLVDQLGLGVRVGEGTEKIPKTVELARALNESMTGVGPQRIKAKKMREATMRANGESSAKDFDEFVRRLHELKM